MREIEFLMMGLLHFGSEIEQADSRIRFAQIGRRGIETLFVPAAQIRAGGRVIVFHDGVGRKMKIGRAVGTERRNVAQKLDGLQFAAELEFQNISHSKVVSRRGRERLQYRAMQVRIGRGEAARSQREGWLRAIRQAMRIGSAHHPGRQTVAVSHIAAEGHVPIGKDGALQLEGRVHVRSGAVATRGRTTGEE